ncbi:MAG TPA: PepSY-associated TM helix domain-containing protein [Rhizomicrobium sp.]
MNFAAFRRLMFQFHMWIGLILGLLLAILGLSGSILVYDNAVLDMMAPRATAQGAPLPLDKIVDAARSVAGRGQVQITLPGAPGEAVSVRVTQPRAGEGARGADRGEARGEGRGQRRAAEGQQAGPQAGPPRQTATQVFIDPVSGAVLGSQRAGLPPALMFAHQLHGNFLMGREGRQFVGWLGVAMLILGVTGLVLWWPKRGQWKYAFLVRRTAKGLRFHRELHAATGIWIFVIFMIVSFSGVVIAFPNMFGMTGGGQAGPNAFNFREGPEIEAVAGATPIRAEDAIAMARKALPNATATGITLPSRRDRTIMVNMEAKVGVGATVYIDPWRGQVVATRDPSASVMAWQRPLHQGSGLGLIWQFLVFLSGLVPVLFVFTGVVMWLKKRKRHIPMSAVLAEEAVG